jgi:aldose sugar dehydrogenase
MRFIVVGIVIFFLGIIAAIYYLYPTLYGIAPDRSSDVPRLSALPSSQPTDSTQSGSPGADIPVETIIAEGLDTPWAIAFLPDGGMLVTERAGRIRLVDPAGNLKPEAVATLGQVKEIGEGGLLGIELHPDFKTNNYVYVYYTYAGNGNNTLNRVARLTYTDGKFGEETPIVDEIPGASNHNGGRIKFGPDKYLYITTGDAQDPSLAQNKDSFAGKILRVTDKGGAINDNPFNDLVYSYGHRNPQGIAWDKDLHLWETEHGPSGGNLGTGNDEINFIEPGNNYGWPEIQGDESAEGMTAPARNSTASTVWAPGGAAVINNSLFFGGLRGQALYEAIISNNRITGFSEHFKGKYGRIREVIKGPDGMLYITTSNRDGRGVPNSTDDRVIRINTSKL